MDTIYIINMFDSSCSNIGIVIPYRIIILIIGVKSMLIQYLSGNPLTFCSCEIKK